MFGKLSSVLMAAKNRDAVVQWYTFSGTFLLLLIIVYAISHELEKGAEIIKLSKQEITDVNLILFGTNAPDVDLGNDPNASDSLNNSGNENAGGDTTAGRPSDELRKETVYRYIFSVREPSQKADSTILVEFFRSYNLQQFAIVIANYPIKCKSYFWLTSPMVYLEVIFWSLFGLIASLFYYVSEAARKDEFEKKEISVHIAKFFYTPVCAIIIFISVKALTKTGDIAIAEFSHGTMVLSFILGFFSGRTIELIGKIKDVILPVGPSTGAETVTEKKPQRVINDASKSSFSSLPLEQQDALIQEYLEHHGESWKNNFPEITGIGSARKRINDEAIDLLCVTFQVQKKASVSNPLPKIIEYKGYQIPTDVEQHDITKPNADGTIDLEAGVSRLNDIAFGTLGIPVTDGSDDYVLSCYHVLFNQELEHGNFRTDKNTSIGSRDVITPSFLDSGSASNKIGEIVEGEINQWVDIGVFKPVKDKILNHRFTKIPGPFGVYQLRRDDENKTYVQFWGNGSKRVCAFKVQNIYSSQWIEYKVNQQRETRYIQGLIQLNQPARPGDSGAPVFDSAGNYVGTLVGSDSRSAYLISARSIKVKTKYKIKTS